MFALLRRYDTFSDSATPAKWDGHLILRAIHNTGARPRL